MASIDRLKFLMADTEGNKDKIYKAVINCLKTSKASGDSVSIASAYELPFYAYTVHFNNFDS